MVLVDTSVWIRALSNRNPYKEELDRLLSFEEVVSHEMVYGELMIGDRGGREQFLAVYECIFQAASVPHGEVVQFVRKRRLQGRGVGWIDMHLLASAIVERLQIWTADQRFIEVAKEFGLAYDYSGAAGGTA